MSGNGEWRQRNVRIVVTRGHYHGQRGRLVRPDGPGTWMVKLDDHMLGASVKATDMIPEGNASG